MASLNPSQREVKTYKWKYLFPLNTAWDPSPTLRRDTVRDTYSLQIWGVTAKHPCTCSIQIRTPRILSSTQTCPCPRSVSSSAAWEGEGNGNSRRKHATPSGLRYNLWRSTQCLTCFRHLKFPFLCVSVLLKPFCVPPPSPHFLLVAICLPRRKTAFVRTDQWEPQLWTSKRVAWLAAFIRNTATEMKAACSEVDPASCHLQAPVFILTAVYYLSSPDTVAASKSRTNLEQGQAPCPLVCW